MDRLGRRATVLGLGVVLAIMSACSEPDPKTSPPPIKQDQANSASAQSSTATPVQITPDYVPGAEHCRRAIDAERGHFALELEPSSPRDGEPVTVRGEGIDPGSYQVQFEVQGREFQRPLSLGSLNVDASGRLELRFVIFGTTPDHCLMLVARGSGPARYTAQPFAASHAPVALPDRCTALNLPSTLDGQRPRDLVGLRGPRDVELNPAQPAAGDRVTARVGGLASTTAALRVVAGPGDAGFVDLGTIRLDETGVGRFQMPAEFLGACIQLSIGGHLTEQFASHALLSPAACAALPDTPAGATRLNASVTARTLRVSGNLPVAGTQTFDVQIGQHFGSVGPKGIDARAVSQGGELTFEHELAPHAAWSGTCATVYFRGRDVSGSGYARFDYP